MAEAQKAHCAALKQCCLPFGNHRSMPLQHVGVAQAGAEATQQSLMIVHPQLVCQQQGLAGCNAVNAHQQLVHLQGGGKGCQQATAWKAGASVKQVHTATGPWQAEGGPVMWQRR